MFQAFAVNCIVVKPGRSMYIHGCMGNERIGVVLYSVLVPREEGQSRSGSGTACLLISNLLVMNATA